MSRIPNTERRANHQKSVDLKMLANLAEVLMEQSLGKSEINDGSSSYIRRTWSASIERRFEAKSQLATVTQA